MLTVTLQEASAGAVLWPCNLFAKSVYWRNEEIGGMLQLLQQYVNFRWVCQHS